MMMRLLAVVLPLLSSSGLALGRLPDGRLHGNAPPRPGIPRVAAPAQGVQHAASAATIPPYNTTYFFDQLIDHNDPSLGTFQQRYWHTWEYYESGGPIILLTPGEQNAEGFDGYLTNLTINGKIAQQEHGAAIVIEHRFYGLSNPYNNLSVASLKYHTIQQGIDDLEYFAKTVKLPMPGGDAVAPGQAAWILIGGSYSGALTSFTMVNKPGLFWAGYASSATVQNIVDFWGYFEPIRQSMPKNCSADVEAVIAHFDDVFENGTQSEIDALKDAYGMANVTHLDDVTGALRNNLWDWQDLEPSSGPNTKFFKFCDALEVKDGVSAPESGWGADHAVSAWGSFFKNTYLPNLCDTVDAEDCLSTYLSDQTFWTSIDVDNSQRSWSWIVCNEVGFLQVGAPTDKPTLVSRLNTVATEARQCQEQFPAAWSSTPTIDVEKTNAAYHGWNVTVDRLFFANGQRDPWREATLSADGVNVQSTSSQVVAVSDGFHCSDLLTRNARVDNTILEVHTQALASMKTWLADWTPTSSKRELDGTVHKRSYAIKREE